MIDPLAKNFAIGVAAVAALIVYTAFFFPGFLPNYMPDECKAAYHTGSEPCSYLYIALSPIPRVLAFIGDDEVGLGRYAQAFFVGLTAVFTGTLWWTTRNLSSATRDLVQNAEITAERQLRAYIAFDKGTVAMNDGGIFIEIKFRNTGQTPAYDVYTVADVGVYPKGASLPGISEIAKPPDLRVIGPKQKMPFVKIFKPSADEMKAIESMSLRAYIWGRVNYIDAFKEPRYLDFKCRVSRHAAGFWALQPTEGGEKAN